ncbi:MAG: calcium/sodium antiporter [Trueperaceae bacterium]
MNVVLVVVGLLGLYLGGELLVRSASALARALGIAPMVIGLTVVAFGTSAPELAATLVAAFRGAPELAIANVIGSNVANIGLILGLTALAYPLATSASFLRREVPWMLAATVLVLPLLFDGRLLRLEGLLLWLALAAFLLAAFRTAGAPDVLVDEAGGAATRRQPWRDALGVAVGVAVLAFGAHALVTGATALALIWGVPERVIGLTLVALGTSLPELASSLVAALRRETDIILGNVIGSNLFNLLAVLGTAAVVHPIEVPAVGLRLDLLIMLGFSLAVVPLMLLGRRLGRRDGALLLVAYLTYVVWLYL